MRKIGFPYDGLPNEISITFDDRLISFLMEYAKRLDFTFAEQEEIRRLLFSMGWDSMQLSFPLSQREFPDATLGIVDPYTLGELDSMTLNFKMWPDMSGLVPSGHPGAGGTNIFDFTEPLTATFPFAKNIHGIFDLGDFFMGGYGLPLQKLFMYIRNSDRTKLPALISDIYSEAKDVTMYLSPKSVEALSFLELYCKSVLGQALTLGEMDPLTLGAFDSLPLWRLSEQAASALQLTTSTGYLDVNVEPDLQIIEKQIRVEGKPVANSDTEITGVTVSKHLSGLHCCRLALLGDMDAHTFEELDNLPLSMHYYGKIPAIVTVEAES